MSIETQGDLYADFECYKRYFKTLFEYLIFDGGKYKS